MLGAQFLFYPLSILYVTLYFSGGKQQIKLEFEELLLFPPPTPVAIRRLNSADN